MKASAAFFDKLIEFEGLLLKAYLDSAGIPTIGIGTIKYPNGKKVKMGDVCTKDQAIQYAKHDVAGFETGLNSLLPGICITQPQFDAMLLLTYNIGLAGFKGSTVLKLVLKNSRDPKIEDAWLLWNKAKVNGVLKPIKGLTNRRKAEYAIYATG